MTNRRNHSAAMIPDRVAFLLIFLLCGGSLGFGIYLEIVQGLEPCPLCMIQRLLFAGAGLLGLLAAVHAPARTGSRVYSAFIGLSALAGGGVAGRQVWLQRLPPDQVPQCGPGFDYLMDTYPMLEALAKILRGSGECAEIGWSFLSLSIAEWALGLFIVLLGLCIVQIARPPAIRG
ncbi:MAG: disulfide bond formation protein B [Gammaproteobacteria bacterium]